MNRMLLVALALVAGCKKEEAEVTGPVAMVAPPKPKAKLDGITPITEPGMIQPRIGGGDVDDQPKLAFKITRAYDKQQSLDAAPWHKDGGDWIFFDAQTDGADPASFTFGFMSKAPENAPFAFGDGWLVAPDRAQADKFLAQFGKAFHQAVPAHASKPGGPLKMRLAVLGRNVGRSPGGGYGGKGDWIATKLFPQKPKLDGEVFFNFSVGSKQGEFAEKDSDYNKDVMAVFAQTL